ncbi:HIT family protein [Tessaracoccus coleopterorum]|uniref:HIT family protein n=1 Tax=Tessaracoccus coleopterorum TaxID=2714950 RepID=UPI001E5B40AE|nr:HIT domain-containing protein [Tessaracoccus coleopterorum]
MTQNATSAAQVCIFCAIAGGQHEASVVYEDESVVAFMDRYPVTRGHLLVVPRLHVVGLDDLDAVTSAHTWSVGHEIARALRRSSLACEGINVLVCDGEAAFQSVFHFHLHIIPGTRATAGPSIPRRRNASGHSSTTTRKKSSTP